MQNEYASQDGSTAVAEKPRRRLKPEVVARLARSSAADVSNLYSKPVEQLTPLEIQRMKQAFFNAL